MDFFLPLVVSILGTSFFFVYLSSKIEVSGLMSQGLKLFLVLSSLVIILLSMSLPHTFVVLDNSTQYMTNCTFSTFEGAGNYTKTCTEWWNPDSTAMNSAVTSATTNLEVTMWIVVIAIFLFVVWMIYEMFSKASKNGSGGKNK